jgi:hypothetical protein
MNSLLIKAILKKTVLSGPQKGIYFEIIKDLTCFALRQLAPLIDNCLPQSNLKSNLGFIREQIKISS